MIEEWYSNGSITIEIHKSCFLALQDLLILPEYHLDEPRSGLYHENEYESIWYESLKIYDIPQIIKIDGIKVNKINKRFLEYNYKEMPIFLAISLLGKHRKYQFKVVIELYESICSTNNLYGVLFDGKRLIYRESCDDDPDVIGAVCLCECGEFVENEDYYVRDPFDLPVGFWNVLCECDNCGKTAEIALRKTEEAIYHTRIEDGKLFVESDSKHKVDAIIKKATDIANQDGICMNEEPDGSEGDWGYSYCDLDSICITCYKGGDVDVIIPSQIDGAYVEEIGFLAFAERSDIRSVVISDGVHWIYYRAFQKCTGLLSVTFPDSLLGISGEECGGAFYGCTGLTSIVLPKNIYYLGECSFSDCSNLKTVVIPDSVEEIGSGAFAGCSSLEKIEIPEGIVFIGKSTFENCSSLASVVIPNTVEEIKKSAFQGCTALNSVVIPPSCKCIHEYAFSGCINLSEVTLHEGVEIHSKAFHNCPKVKL